jgi:hypothetical protein
MPVTTRKANATAHPGHIVLSSQTTRRSRQQIESDRAQAKAAAKAAKVQANVKHHAVLTRIAELEDELEEEDTTMHLHSARPDLEALSDSISVDDEQLDGWDSVSDFDEQLDDPDTISGD